MGIRSLLMPWWLRWLMLVAAMTIMAVPMWMLFMPDDGSSLPVRFLQVPVLSVGVATIITFVQERFRRPVLAILDGLDPGQQRLAIRASQRGDIPSDPPVLTAAVRLCTLLVGSRLRTPHWVRWFTYLIPAVAAILAVVGFAMHDVRRATAYLVWGALIAATFWWDTHTARRRQQRLELLRTTASASIGEVPTLTEADYPPVLPSRKAWLISFLVIVAMCVVTAFGSYMLDKPRRQCDTAARIIIDIVGDHEFTHSEVILPGGPSISDFEEWSRRLHETASKVSRPDLAPHTRKIADLSDQAVTVVRRTRQSPEPSKQDEQRLAYLLLIKQMLDEHDPIYKTCRKR